MKSKGSIYLNYFLKGLLISCSITLLFTMIISLLLTYTNMMETSIPLWNTITLIVSIVSGAMYSTVKIGEKGWLNGAIIGLLYFLILFLLNYLLVKSSRLNSFSYLKLFISIVIGMIGGMIGINLK
jgi:putative membrane protein (TIGR04086 family)